jgi:hypothetical protein
MSIPSVTNYSYTNRTLVFKRLNLLSDVKAVSQKILKNSSDLELKQGIKLMLRTLPNHSVATSNGFLVFSNIFNVGNLSAESVKPLLEGPDGTVILQDSINFLTYVLGELKEIEQELS